MKIGFLITARLKSSRLKLKLLKPLNGRSVIEHVIVRAKQIAECEDIVLCTSTNSQDLPLCRIAVANDIYYYTGDPEDVLKRLLDAATFFNFDYFIGITADNPLFSIYHANLLSDLIRQEPGIDFAFTTGMPVGVNMYALKIKALKTVCAIKEEIDTEIWGYLINRPEIFNVREIPVDPEYISDVPRITLDEINDYNFFREIFNHFRPDEIIDILDVYKFLKDNPQVKNINKNVIQRDLDNETKERINTFFKKNHEKIIAIKNKIYSS